MVRKIRTAEEIPHLGGFMMLPTPEGTCEECAVDHDPELPHNRDSLPYQYAFYGKHGRWPTWDDAMAHCTDEVKARWRTALANVLAEGDEAVSTEAVAGGE